MSGQRLSHFEILERLGQGGMGVVQSPVLPGQRAGSPGTGRGYLNRKIEIEKLLADRKQQQGETFRMKRFKHE